MTADAVAAPAAADHVLRLEREFSAPPDRVYAAWTDRAKLAAWWGPQGYSCPSADLDLRPGGRWRTCMLSPEGKENWVSGVYLEVVPNRRLRFTWAWEEKGVRGPETAVALEFQASARGTRLVLVHSGFDSAGSRDNHGKGWTSALLDLEQALA